MPPKRGSTGPRSKEDVSDKVREIKERQKNWFKQRDKSLKQSNEAGDTKQTYGPSSSSTPGASRDYCKAGSHKPAPSDAVPAQKCSPKPAPINRKTTTVQKGFNSWLKARAESQQSGPLDQGEDSDGDYYETESDVTIDELASRGGGSSSATPTPSVCDGRGYQQSESSGHLSADQFDALADQIVDRVKRELKVTRGTENVTHSPHHKPAYSFTTTISSQSNEKQQDTSSHASHLDSHYCPQCSSLMVPSVHSPTLIIPCGHTVCKKCSTTMSTCPVCKCPINSLTPNIMLQQIIVDYKQRSAADRTQQPDGYRASKYKGKESYKEDYNSLVLRCQVLESETENIHENIASIQGDIDQERRQVTNIMKAEQRTLDEIQELENRLEELRRHRAEYEDKCSQLESKQDAERSRLNLVQTTLADLRKEAKKVKTLAGEVEESW